MFKKTLAVLSVMFSLAGCTRRQAAETTTQSAAVSRPPAEKLVSIKVTRFEITPASIRKSDSTTAHVELDHAPAGTRLTLAWFASNGPLVHDEIRELTGNAATFTIPPGTFPNAGTFNADLLAEGVHLAEGRIEVVE